MVKSSYWRADGIWPYDTQRSIRIGAQWYLEQKCKAEREASDSCWRMAMSTTFKTMSSHVSWEWPTPRIIYEELNTEFSFNFDPCPLGGNTDGRSTLFCEWKGKRVFCNPPYGPQIPKFLARAHEAEIAVFLLPARTDTKWFHEIVLSQAKEIRFIKGRLRNDPLVHFPSGRNISVNSNPWPFPSMIAIFGEKVLGKPKFRIGDKVTIGLGDKITTIHDFSWIPDERHFFYSCDDALWRPEYDLHLVRRGNKKALDSQLGTRHD